MARGTVTSPGKDPYDDPLHRTGLALGAGSLFAGLILIGKEILRLRKRPDRGQLLWTVSTSASQAALVIAAGQSLCLRVVVTQTNGAQITMLYDGTAGIADTRLIPPGIVAWSPRARAGHSSGDEPASFGIDAEVYPMTRENRGALNMTLLAVACGLLMVMPLVTTLDDFLTTWALQLGANNPLQAIVPGEARMVVGLLGLFGVHAAASGNYMVVWDGGGAMHTLLISWNCIGGRA